jgi:PAS domain S-box-containing protein
VAFLVKNSGILRQLQLFKDGLYLIVTAGLLYALINSLLTSQPPKSASSASEGKFRQLTENIREVFWLMSLNPSQVIYVSPTYESIWCRTCESLYKQPMSWIEAVHPDDREQVLAAVERRYRSQGDSDYEYRIIQPDGSIRWIRDRAFPVCEQVGQVNRIAGVAEDITNRKQLETKLRKLNEELDFRIQKQTVELQQTTEQLGVEISERQRAEEERDQFFMLSLDMFCIAGFDGYFKQLNPAWEKKLGFTQEELLALPYLELVHPEDRTATVTVAQQLNTGTDIATFEHRYRCKDGSYKWLSWHSTVIPNRKLVYAVVQDITEQKQAEASLEESNQRIVNILESITDAFLTLDHQWRYTYLNRHAEQLLQKTQEELLGRRIWDVFPDIVDTIFFEKYHEAVAKQVSIEFEGFYSPWNSWYEIHAYPSKDGLAIYFTDITQRKQTQAELLKALEKERELNELKSRIVTVVSHEYRTPLTTILSSAELLEHYGNKWTEEKKLVHLRRIQSTVHHLTQLVSDVLFLDKTEAGKVEFNPSFLEVVTFCGEIVEEIQLTVGNKHKLIFVSQGECRLAYLDEKLLRQILTNLLSNAIKYCPESGTVQFALFCKPDKVVFHIQDEGIGIPKDEQQQLFESFQRASNVGTIPGTGLGLAIVKKCVDLHGGQITVESEVGIGTTFAVTLPLSIQKAG